MLLKCLGPTEQKASSARADCLLKYCVLSQPVLHQVLLCVQFLLGCQISSMSTFWPAHLHRSLGLLFS